MRRNRPRKSYKLLFVAFSLLAVVVGGAIVGALNTVGKPVEANANTPAVRNDARKAQLKLMSDALSTYISQVGQIPVPIPTNQVGICSAAAAACRAAGLVDLTFLISKGDIASLPSDPMGGHDRYGTGYTIGRDSNGDLLLSAPRAEDGAVITQTVK